MNPKQALDILRLVAESVRVSYKEHRQIQEALSVLEGLADKADIEKKKNIK